MQPTNYSPLHALDQAFLHFETPSCYMHMALVAVFEGGSLLPRRGLDITRIRRHITAKLHLTPRYRQRIEKTPIVGDPVWVDDPHFDINDHVHLMRLPAPGSDQQLRELCASILARPLDRYRPLWEIHCIEGLRGGGFALLGKVHHCLVDGVAGIELFATMLRPEPTPQLERAKHWRPLPSPGRIQLLIDDAYRRLGDSAVALRGLGAALKDGRGESARLRTHVAALWQLLRAEMSEVRSTPLNRTLGRHRRMEWLQWPWSDVAAIRRELGGTVNDVVLSIVSGAMRRFLSLRDVDVDRHSFHVMVPVNTRATDAESDAGNHVSAWLVPLPIQESTCRRTHEAICATTAQLKQDEQALSTQILTEVAGWITSAGFEQVSRLLRRTCPFNLIVTNIPGPPEPLYLMDARMRSVYPFVPLFENQGLGVALLSYAGQLWVGLVGDRDIVPDLAKVADCFQESFAELRKTAVERRDTTADSDVAAAIPRLRMRGHHGHAPETAAA